MNGELLQPLLFFVGSALLVVTCGVFLAKYGDVLAELTGWGRLWVGTILVAVATSLPELIASITAASRDQPELVGGNVFGTNMVNIFVLAIVVLLFGGAGFFRRVASTHSYLVIIAITLTSLAVLLSTLHIGVSVRGVGLASILLLVLYLAGMRIVYMMRPREVSTTTNGPPAYQTSAGKAWLYFGLASLGVVIAAPFLAYSVEEIAEVTGLAKGFLGVVAVALVTTMPEASATIAAARLGAADLAIGNLYGSCAFTILVLALADPFYREGPLLESLGREPVAAGLIAVLLMVLGLWQILLRGQSRRIPTRPVMALICLVYGLGLFLVYSLG